jgi:hypothetical protein
MPLSLLDIGVPQHQLNRADVDAVGQEAAGAFGPQVVPAQVDLANAMRGCVLAAKRTLESPDALPQNRTPSDGIPFADVP